MAWLLLVLAGMFEVGWPLGFKLAQTTEHQLSWISFSVAAMALSGWLLYLAQRTIPIGIAYASWTGIGAVGTFLIGVMFFKDSSSLLSWLGLAMIIGGIMLLKFSHLSAS